MENLNDLSAIDRPREKMLLHGPAALSDTELLAILLAFGSKELPVLSLCDKVMQAAKYDLESLASMSLEDVCKVKGIGTAKGAMVLAAMELGRRRLSQQNKIPMIISDADAIRLVAPHFKNVKERLFVLVLLNRNYELLATCEIQDHIPAVSPIMQLVLEAGAICFGIVRNVFEDDADFLAAETKILADLGSAAKMLKLKYLGRLFIE